MAKKIENIGNYTVITDTVSAKTLFEAPSLALRYRRVGNNKIEIYPETNFKRLSYNLKADESDFVDSGDVAIADIYDWLRKNTGETNKRVYLDYSDFAPNADGVTDDSTTLQTAIDRAIAAGLPLYIPTASYKIDAELTIDGKLEIIGNKATLVVDTAVAQFSLFTKTTDTDLTIKDLIVDATSATSANGVIYLNVIESFTNSTINLDGCEYLAFADELSNIFLYIDPDLQGEKVFIQNCTTNNAVVFYFDTTTDIYLTELHVYSNVSDNCPRWFLRAQSFGPATSGYVVTDAWVKDNKVTNINGNITDKSNVARVIQVEVGNAMHVEDNIFDTSETTGAGNAVYMNKGSLYFERNLVKDLQGVNTTAIIDDKGDDTATEEWFIRDNVFDQSGLTHANDVSQAIIRILAQQNVVVSGNVGIGLKTLFVYVYQSVNNTEFPENIIIDSNIIYSIDYPCVVGLKQDMNNIKVTNNVVHSITNTNSIFHDGRSDPSLVVCYQTFNNSGEGITNVTIEGNVVHYCDRLMYLVRMWINAAAPDAIMDRITIINNSCHIFSNFSALCFFTTGATLNDITNVVSANNVAKGMTEDQGSRPADVTQQNNIL